MIPCVSLDQQHDFAWGPWRGEKICIHCELRVTMTDEEMAGEPWRPAVADEGEGE